MKGTPVIALALVAAPESGFAGEGLRVHEYRFGDGLTVSSGDDLELNLTGYVQPAVEMQDYLGTGPSGANPRFRLRRLRLRLAGRALQRGLFPAARRPQRLERGGRRAGRLPARRLRGLPPDPHHADPLRAANDLHRQPRALHPVALAADGGARPRDLGVLRDPRVRAVHRRPHSPRREQGLPSPLSRDHQWGRPQRVLPRSRRPEGGGRIDYLPFGLLYNRGQFREVDVVRELVPRLVVGVAYSYNFGMSSRRGRGSGNMIYLGADGNESLPGFGKLGVDFSFKYRGFWMLGEFNITHADVPEDITQRVRNNGSISTNFDVTENVGRIFTSAVLLIGLGVIAVPSGMVASALTQVAVELEEAGEEEPRA